MNILGIIPARAGSKRVPNKNSKLLGGKPLVQHIIEASCLSKKLTTVLVSSDSDAVLQIAGNYSNLIALRRPDELSDDTAPAIDYVLHALSFLEKKNHTTYDIIVILQPSSPLTLADDIDKTIELLIESGADSAVSVMELGHDVNPLKMKVLEGNKLIAYLEDERGRMAAHELPKIYVRNCAVYATTADTIAKKQIIGDDCRAYIMPRERSVDINDPIDFDFAEFLFQKNLNRV
jgi:CMP-N,N'-diacetyllegionaminic acid synthase